MNISDQPPSPSAQYKETNMNKPSLTVDADGKLQTCAKGAEAAECGYKAGAKVCGKCGAVPKMAQPTEDAEMEMSTAKKTLEVTADGFDREAAREQRLMSLGVKSAEIDSNAFLCGFERKMLGGGSSPCATCPGGCAPEQNLPTLLEIEGLAEGMFGGKVLDSGYGEQADLFLVDMERKDGKVIEVIFDGQTGEVQSWSLLRQDLIGEKSAEMKVISSDDAADIAVKSIEGNVLAVDADRFELEDGTAVDAWAVEIDAPNGKSYDVFVGLDGELLGYDEYDLVDSDDEVTNDVALKAAKKMQNEDEEMDEDPEEAAAEAQDVDGESDEEMPDVDPEADEDEEMDEDGKPKSGKKTAAPMDDQLWAALAEFELLVAEQDLDND